MENEWILLIAFAVGFLVSLVNSMAGGGSIFSLPFLMSLGLTSVEANATNRISLFMGVFGALSRFRQAKLVHLKDTVFGGIGIILGSIGGSWWAVGWDKETMRITMAWVIFIISILGILKSKQPKSTSETIIPKKNVWTICIFSFFLGLYMGVIQIGFGILFIFVFSRIYSNDLVKVNAMKATLAMIGITCSLPAYMIGKEGLMHWLLGGAMGIGNLSGGWLGAHLQIKHNGTWLKWLVFFMGLFISGKILFEIIF